MPVFRKNNINNIKNKISNSKKRKDPYPKSSTPNLLIQYQIHISQKTIRTNNLENYNN